MKSSLSKSICGFESLHVEWKWSSLTTHHYHTPATFRFGDNVTEMTDRHFFMVRHFSHFNCHTSDWTSVRQSPSVFTRHKGLCIHIPSHFRVLCRRILLLLIKVRSTTIIIKYGLSLIEYCNTCGRLIFAQKRVNYAEKKMETDG